MPPIRLPLSALLLATAGAHGATVTIVATDAAGKPIADAIALLEPVSGRVPVKPMADAEISQAKRRFEPRVTLITTGTKVSFPNFDTVRHHVYSFSAAKTFELKLYAGVPQQPIVFDKPGIAVLGCNIHDKMAAWVVIADTPWSGRSGADGRIEVDAVPAGDYRLTVWHPALPSAAVPAPQVFKVTGTDAPKTVSLAIEAAP